MSWENLIRLENLDKINNELSSKFRSHIELIDFIYSSDADELHDILALDFSLFNEKFFISLLKNYNSDYYNLIQKHKVNYKELYFELLDLENNDSEILDEILAEDYSNIESLMINYSVNYKLLSDELVSINVLDLPEEIIVNHIISELTNKTLTNLCVTNVTFNEICVKIKL